MPKSYLNEKLSDDNDGYNTKSNMTVSTTKDDRDGIKSDEKNLNPVALLFEDVVHHVSGNTEYKFGDISKRSISMMTGKGKKPQAVKVSFSFDRVSFQ